MSQTPSIVYVVDSQTTSLASSGDMTRVATWIASQGALAAAESTHDNSYDAVIADRVLQGLDSYAEFLLCIKDALTRREEEAVTLGEEMSAAPKEHRFAALFDARGGLLGYGPYDGVVPGAAMEPNTKLVTVPAAADQAGS